MVCAKLRPVARTDEKGLAVGIFQNDENIISKAYWPPAVRMLGDMFRFYVYTLQYNKVPIHIEHIDWHISLSTSYFSHEHMLIKSDTVVTQNGG